MKAKIYPVEIAKDLETVKQLFTVYADYIFELLNSHSLSLAERLRRKALDEAAGYKADKWLRFKSKADAKEGTYSVSVNDKKVVKNASFAEKATELQRLSFRTGEYRKVGIGKDESSEDQPNAGDPVKEAVYYVNNVFITP